MRETKLETNFRFSLGRKIRRIRVRIQAPEVPYRSALNELQGFAPCFSARLPRARLVKSTLPATPRNPLIQNGKFRSQLLQVISAAWRILKIMGSLSRCERELVHPCGCQRNRFPKPAETRAPAKQWVEPWFSWSLLGLLSPLERGLCELSSLLRRPWRNAIPLSL